MDIYMVRLVADYSVYFIGTLDQCQQYGERHMQLCRYDIVKAKVGSDWNEWEIVQFAK